MSRVSRCFIWILIAAGLAMGCGRQAAGPGANGIPPDEAAPTAPPSPRGPGFLTETNTNPTVIADTGDANATLQQLTQALRDYVVRTRSVPKDFEEFVSKSQVRFPPAPPGKKYAIQGQTVVLANR